MSAESQRPRRAGDSVDDLCRACKTVRVHTVMAASSDGTIVRVVCDYCSSQHNYRGIATIASASASASPAHGRTGPHVGVRPPGESRGFTPEGRADAFPLVSERERRYTTVSEGSVGDKMDVETIVRRVLREELGLTPVVPAEKWRGGAMVLKPGRPGLQEKSWPIETFFHKVVMLRNRLRVLEQQINAAELPEDMKVKLQSYVTGCYGTLTSFNVLFAEDEDRFKGSEGPAE